MRNLLKISSLFLLLALGLPVAGQQSARLDTFLLLLEKHNKAMGCLKINSATGSAYERCFGMARIDKSKKNGPSTIFRIGSVSKTFTAVIVLKLVEQGKLSLNDRLGQWFPEIENASDITIEHLLRHRSGIYNYTDTSEYDKYYTHLATHSEMLARITRYGSIFKPGERMHYSNSNYLLLGYIAERITGKDYATLVEEMIARPCGLKNTRPGDAADTSTNGALSYRALTGWVPDPLTHSSVSLGGGSLVSSPDDLIRFMQCLMNGHLVSSESLRLMMSMHDGYGMGLVKYPFYEKEVYGHTGGIDAFRAFVGFLPTDSVYIALCSNGLAVSLNDILIGVLSIWYGMPYQFPDFSTAVVDPLLLKRYEGTYISKQLPLEIRVWEKEGHLMAQAAGQSEFPLEAVSDTTFRFTPAQIQMIFDTQGQGFTLRQAGMEFSFTKKQISSEH
ncbi:MAG: serine hydrolase domain-containing protein [Bacteroidales bacterium]